MSVPLDRIYSFLQDVANFDDIIIYHFFPHGSRNLDHIKELSTAAADAPWAKLMTMPCMIMHDQEPLMYHLYAKEDFKKYLEKNRHKLYPKVLIDVVSDLHLRACIHATTNMYDQTLLCHSENNSKNLVLYEQHGFIGVYYWSHALIARDWYRYAEIDPTLSVNFTNITHDFLIYSRAWSGTREYRLTLAEMLVDQQLVPNCKTSFAALDNELHYTQFKFTNPELAILRNDLHELLPVNTHDSSASANYDSKDYATTAIEVVLETLFDDDRLHLTEKTLRPIACGRPFILAAAPGSLQYLKKYGFETFDSLIDETYDTITNPKQRLLAITQEMDRIKRLPYHEKLTLWKQLYAISDRNKKLFFSKDWHRLIVDEFKNNFDLAIGQLTATGKHQDKLDHIASSKDPEMLRWRTTYRPNMPTSEDRIKLAQWLKEKNAGTTQ